MLFYQQFLNLLKDIGYNITENENGIKSMILVEEILKRQNIVQDRLLNHRVVGIPNLQENEKKYIVEKFSNYIQDDDFLSDFNLVGKCLMESLNDCIRITEKVIIRITNDCEKTNNVF